MQLIGSFSSRKCCPTHVKSFHGHVLIWAMFPLKKKKKKDQSEGGEMFRESRSRRLQRSFSIPAAQRLSLGNALYLAA